MCLVKWRLWKDPGVPEVGKEILWILTPASEKILLSRCNHIPSRMKDKLLCLVSTPKSEAQVFGIPLCVL